MKTFKMMTALLLASVAGNATAEPVKVPGKNFSVTKFGDNIEAAMAPVTVGWAYSIAKDGKKVDAKGGGFARTKIDGVRAHGPDQRQNIASVSKTVTAVAVLQLLAKLKLHPNVAIGPYLPSDWKRGPNIDKVRFADLLRHRSGIATGDMNSINLLKYEAVQAVVAKGTTVQPAPGMERPSDYDNMNYALLRVLVPQLWKATGADPFKEALGMYGQLGELALGSEGLVGNWNAYGYIAYVQKNVLAPIGIRNGLCSDKGAAETLYYTPAGDQKGTRSFGDNNWTRACGSGGWYLSANDLTNLMAHVRHTEKLLPEDYRNLMLERSYGLSQFKATGGTGYGKSGVVGAGAGTGLRACTMMLPGNIEASVVENSATKVELDICGVLKTAYEKAWI